LANRTRIVDQSIAGASLPLGIRISRSAHRYARFLFPAPAVITVDSAHTVGWLRFDNTNAVTIGATSSSNLTLNNNPYGAAAVVVNSGSHIIAENVLLAGNTIVSPASGTTLTVGISGNTGSTCFTACWDLKFVISGLAPGIYTVTYLTYTDVVTVSAGDKAILVALAPPASNLGLILMELRKIAAKVTELIE